MYEWKYQQPVETGVDDWNAIPFCASGVVPWDSATGRNSKFLNTALAFKPRAGFFRSFSGSSCYVPASPLLNFQYVLLLYGQADSLMKQSNILVSLVAALPAVHGIAFGGPVPTATSPERALDGTNPKPTKGPSVSELRKRQSNLFPETCGWVDGDFCMSL